MEETDKSVYAISAPLLDGRPVSLDRFKGSVLLIVNTASKCGFTPQYAGLEQLYLTYKDRGFAVLGFPCNQFGHQEPGTAKEIGMFCQCSYGVSFPMFEKIEVNGSAAHPLYRFLKEGKRGLFGTKRIKWNFTKFLVDRNGNVVDRFAPATDPVKLRYRIESLLEKD
ncbi:MAG: glutathione peroxidase [Terracidiphilus sp.]